ncbi:MAG: hypothetical protein R6W73_01805 [Candidatus Saliniplasma sp.]
MPTRYVCKKCSKVEKKKKVCSVCGSNIDSVEFPWTWRTALPYILAGVGAVLLLLSHILEVVALIWIIFVLIAVGLISDHLYQKELDRRAVEKIKKAE